MGSDYEHEYLDTSVIAHRLKGINSLHTFLIIDACFSGTMVTKLRNAPRSEQHKSRKILTSGRAEVVNDGPAGGNSPFAKGILVALEKNSDLYLRASQLILDVIDYVEKQAKQTPTNGTLFNSGDEGGDFVFRLKLEEENLWNFAISENSLEFYNRYLELFPEGKYKKEAKKRKKNLDKKSRDIGADFYEWIKLQKEGSYKDYQNFIQSFPESEFVNEAKKEMKRLSSVALNKLKIMEANASVSRAAKIKACNNYFKSFPNSEYDLQVKQMRNRLNFPGN